VRECKQKANLSEQIDAGRRALSYCEQHYSSRPSNFGPKIEAEIEAHKVKLEADVAQLQRTSDVLHAEVPEHESHQQNFRCKPLLCGTSWDLMDGLLCKKTGGFHQLRCVFTLLSESERAKINAELPEGKKISPCEECGWGKLFGSDFEENCPALNDATHKVEWQEYDICRTEGDAQVIVITQYLCPDVVPLFTGGQESLDRQKRY
jgi:hypothetical protein